MLNRIVHILFIGTAIGSVTSCSVQVFLYLVEFLSELFSEKNYSYRTFSEITERPFSFLFYIILIPISVGLLVGFIRKFTDGTSWHGPPDVILSAHQSKNPLHIKTGFLTSFSSILSISVGGSVGQYGPLVHFGATLGAEIKSLFSKIKVDYQIFLGSGVAAAISSGFGAPIAGLVFAREVILRHQSLASFAPILVSSLVAYFITKTFFGFEAIFPSSIGLISHIDELPLFILLGILSGFIAVIYMKLLTHKNYFFNISKIPAVIQPAIAAFICGLFTVMLPEVTGLGTTTIVDLVSVNITMYNALIFLIFKLFLTTICIRFGLIGGVFAPALFIGACTGVFFGTILQTFYPDINIALFAASALAAVGSCVIGGPLANMMIIFELTKDYQTTLAAGISIVFASIIASKLVGQSIFDRVLLNRNINLDLGDENLVLQNRSIQEIYHSDFLSLSVKDSVNEAIKRMTVKGYSECYITDLQKKVINKIALSDLLKVKSKSMLLEKIKKRKFLYLSSDENIYNSIDLCKNFVGESIPVISQKKELVGVIGESDLLKIILEVNKNQREIEHKN